MSVPIEIPPSRCPAAGATVVNVPGPVGPKGASGLDITWSSDVWQAPTVYDKNAGVVHNGSSYLSLQDVNQNQEPQGVTDTWWQVIGLKGDTGDDGPTGPIGPAGTPGAGINWRGPWVAGTYALNDGVTSNGSSYVSLQDANTQPVTNQSYWQMIAQKGADGTSATATYLQGIGLGTGGHVISATAKTSATRELVAFATTSPIVTIATAGTYLIFANARIANAANSAYAGYKVGLSLQRNTTAELALTTFTERGSRDNYSVTPWPAGVEFSSMYILVPTTIVALNQGDVIRLAVWKETTILLTIAAAEITAVKLQ